MSDYATTFPTPNKNNLVGSDINKFLIVVKANIQSQTQVRDFHLTVERKFVAQVGKNIVIFRLIVTGGLVLLLAGCGRMTTDSMATGSVSSTMATSGHALAPPAFYAFCARNKRLCSTKGPTRPVQLTEERMRQLKTINVSVNRNVREEPDSVTQGAEDVWTPATTVGDCEDIAILKKKRLLDKGWPASSLLLTVVRPRFGNAGHTVLAVRTDRGDLILDNVTNDVRNWSITPYRYYARQSIARQGEWEFVGRALSQT